MVPAGAVVGVAVGAGVGAGVEGDAAGVARVVGTAGREQQQRGQADTGDPCGRKRLVHRDTIGAVPVKRLGTRAAARVAHNGRMQPVVTPAEMAEADRRAIASGTPEPVLIGRAGRAVAMHAARMLGGTYGRRVVVAAGKGNNGADGREAAARLRARGVGVDVFAVADVIDRAEFVRTLARADLFVDAMFGTGFRGALADPAAWIAATVQGRRTRTLAIDIPSGVDGATGVVAGAAVVADETITFVARKPGLLFQPGRGHAGRVDRRRHRHRARPRQPVRARRPRPPAPSPRRVRAQVVVGTAGVRWFERSHRRTADGRARRRACRRGNGGVQLAGTRSRRRGVGW